jgi:hypothetical protein
VSDFPALSSKKDAKVAKHLHQVNLFFTPILLVFVFLHIFHFTQLWTARVSVLNAAATSQSVYQECAKELVMYMRSQSENDLWRYAKDLLATRTYVPMISRNFGH